MIELVYGGSGSGKSEFAEKEITSLQANFPSLRANSSSLRAERQSNLFYVATMKVSDSESQKKVERHRKLRAGKNFITVEASENLENAAEFISFSSNENSSSLQEHSPSLRAKPPSLRAKRSNLIKKANCQNTCVLLECLSNLVANEMFKDGKIIESEKVVRKIESGLEKLFSAADNVVVVSNNIFDDGIDYDETTREYQKTLAKLNNFVASRADKVYEIAAGIALKMK